jgi:hypothetical protein
VIQSYANCAATVGVATELCVATAALTAAHGLPPYWRDWRGEERATEAKDRPAKVLNRRGIVAIQLVRNAIASVEKKQKSAQLIRNQASYPPPSYILQALSTADLGKNIALELLCKVQSTDIIAAATLLHDPCRMRQFKAMQRMSTMCVIAPRLNRRPGELKEEVEVEVGFGRWNLPGSSCLRVAKFPTPHMRTLGLPLCAT